MSQPGGPYNPYGQQPGYTQGAYAPQIPRRTNGLAVAALILGLTGFITFGFTSVLAIVFGHVSLGQIRRDHTDGHGMALAGVVLGWILTGAWILFWAFMWFGVIAGLGLQAAQSADPSSFPTQLHITQPGGTPATSSAEGGSHTVTFEAEGKGGATSASNVTSSVNFSIKQEQGVPLPYSKQSPVDGKLPQLYLWVQNAGQDGTVACRIKVDGKTVREAASTGPYGVCSVTADAQ